MGAACSRPAADGAGSAGAAAGLQATEPWENTVHHGAAGYRAAMALLESRADAKDEHERLRAYLDRGQALALARGAVNSGAPLRGSTEWRDSDLTACTRASFARPAVGGDRGTSDAWGVDAATAAGTRGGGRRPNQDAFGMAFGVPQPGGLLVTVLDGHGPAGHFIARHVRDRLPAWVAACVGEAQNTPPPTPPKTPGGGGGNAATAVEPGGGAYRAGMNFTLNDATGAMHTCHGSDMPPLTAALRRAYIALDEDLCAGRSTLLAASKVTPDTSGCCAVTALVLDDGTLLVASCGDSSAFLAVSRSRSAGASSPTEAPYLVRPVSLAHKPSGAEATRIRLAGGRIGSIPNEEHILRVWPSESSKDPGFGLAVARAFGDVYWKPAGVCSTPDIVAKTIHPDDAFLVLCTDGVTDVMSPQEVVTCAGTALENRCNAGEAVLKAAEKAWADKWPKHTRDDITVAVLVLQPGLLLQGQEAGA